METQSYEILFDEWEEKETYGNMWQFWDNYMCVWNAWRDAF